MKKFGLCALLTGSLFLAPALRAEKASIYWVVSNGQKVNRVQAERLYEEARRWVEERFGPTAEPIRPSLTVHVGEPCPNPEISGACQGGLSELYLPKWDGGSPGYIVQAVIRLSLQELMSLNELKDVTLDLVTEDLQTFVDAEAAAKPE
jgi:hypothetical protein